MNAVKGSTRCPSVEEFHSKRALATYTPSTPSPFPPNSKSTLTTFGTLPSSWTDAAGGGPLNADEVPPCSGCYVGGPAACLQP